MRAPRFLPLLAAISVVGCFDPDLSGGGYRCTGDTDCPPDQVCDKANKVCRAGLAKDKGAAQMDTGGVKKDRGVTKQDTGAVKKDRGIVKKDTGAVKKDTGTVKKDTGAVKKDSGTTKPKCPNGTKETGEACDGKDFGGATCKSEGHSGGWLTCASNCKAILVTYCYRTTTAKVLASVDANATARPRAVWNKTLKAGMVAWQAPFSASSLKKNIFFQSVNDKLNSLLKNTHLLYASNSHDLIEPALAASGSRQVLVWADSRGVNYDIYGARFDSAGKVETKDAKTVLLNNGPKELRTPAIACGASGECLVVWQDHDNQKPQIRGILLSHTVGGSMTVKNKSVVVTKSAADIHSVPAVATDGSGYLVVWKLTFGTNIVGARIYGRRVDASGKPLGTFEFQVGGAAKKTADTPAIAYMPSAMRYLVAWEDGRNGGADLYAARVSTAGTVLDKGGLPLAKTTLLAEKTPSVACHSAMCVVAYTEGSSSKALTKIKAIRIRDYLGKFEIFDGKGFELASGVAVDSPAIMADHVGNYQVVWRNLDMFKALAVKALTLKL